MAGPLGAPPRRAVSSSAIATLPVIYVTGHRNPDTDSIAAAVGYAELMSRVDTRNRYVPVRLGELNTQTRWVLEQARAQEPEFLPHVMLRVRDVMREDFPQADDSEPVREVGRLMARQDLDLVPIVNAAGALTGVMTERALARRYIRESREPSELDAPTNVSAIVKVLQGECWPAPTTRSPGQIWCMAMDVGALPTEIGPGDVVVVGNRDDAQRAAIELGVGLLVVSNGAQPSRETVALAQDRGVPVVTSPLDSYVTARMITLSAPCRALMDPNPLTVRPDDLLSDVADEVKEVHYRAAVAVDARRTRSGSSPAPTSSTRSRAACCWSTTPSRRRACWASSRPRSSRSSTTTTSARSRPRCRCGPRSTRSAPPRRS